MSTPEQQAAVFAEFVGLCEFESKSQRRLRECANSALARVYWYLKPMSGLCEIDDAE